MIALYERVSTQEQAQNGHSIAEQKSRLEAFCTAKGWSPFAHYTDAGFSGGNTTRPALSQLIQDTKAGKIQMIIVYKLDRLSRSQKDTLSLIEDTFLPCGADFVSISENFDTSTAFGKAMIGILAVFAQLEREQIKERMTIGRTARTKQGYFHGSGTVPIGYDYDGDLHINTYEAGLIRKVFEMASAGTPVRTIARSLNDAGLVHKYGLWNTTTIRKVLSRRLYLGEVCFAGKWYAGRHEPIIDQTTFETVQRLSKTRKEKALESNIRLGRATSLLSGLLFCARCGARYTPQVYTHGKYRYEKYSCASRSKRNKELIKDPSCRNDAWDKHTLESAVFAQIRLLRLEPYKTPTEQQNRANTGVSEKVRAIDGAIKRLIDLYAVQPIPAITEKLEALTAQKEKLLQVQEPQTLSRDNAIDLAAGLDDLLTSGSFDEIRALLLALIDRIEIDGQDLSIFWKFTL